MTPAIPPWGVPRLVNNIFWGGLWGALFALIYEWIPGGMSWLKGLIFGLLIVVVSNWILLPLIKGQVFGQANQVLFGGWDPTAHADRGSSSSAASASGSASSTA